MRQGSDSNLEFQHELHLDLVASLMMLVPAYPLDVVPRSRLMAQVTQGNRIFESLKKA